MVGRIIRPLALVLLLSLCALWPAAASRYYFQPFTPPNAFVACGAGWCAEAEDGQFVLPWDTVVDPVASGGEVLSLPGDSADYHYQVGFRINFACDPCYLWVHATSPDTARNVVWIDTLPFGRYGQPPSNLKGSILFENQPQPTFAFTPIGALATENLRPSPRVNATPQRAFSLADGDVLYVTMQAGVVIDTLYLNPSPTATPALPGGGGTGSLINYTILRHTGDLGIGAANWDQANAVTMTGFDSGVQSPATIRAIWVDGTPDRMCVQMEKTLANLTSTAVADDASGIASDTGLGILLKTANLTREPTADAWRINPNMASPTPFLLDATWPGGVFSTAADLTNVTRARSYSANLLRLMVCFDLPSAVTQGQQALCDFQQMERVTGLPLVSQQAFNTQSPTSSLAEWGICEFSATVITLPVDVTAPTMGSVTFSGVGATSMTASATVADAESGVVSCRARYDTVNDNAVVGGTIVNGGTPVAGSCSVNLTGLTSGQNYEVVVEATNGQGLVGTSAVGDQATTSAGATRYLCPTGGSDGNTGTSAGQCWATWAYATNKARLLPGYTLLVTNGTFNSAFPSIDCRNTGNANNGTAVAPITIRAENERQAFLRNMGTGYAMVLTTCTYWRIEGLRFRKADVSGDSATYVVSMTDSTNIQFKRNLLSHDNRYTNSALLSSHRGGNNLIEENGFYYFHRHAVSFKWDHTGSIFRRNYCHSRAYADIAGGFASGPAATGRGDYCIALYPGSNHILENNVSEGNQTLSTIEATETSNANRMLGNLSRGDISGFSAVARGNSVAQMTTNSIYRHNLILTPSSVGMYLRAQKNVQVENTTVYGSTGNSGFVIDSPSADDLGDGILSFFGTNLLSMLNSSSGFVITAAIDSWNLAWSHAYSNTTNFSPTNTNANITNEYTPLNTNPNLGGCRVMIPSGSPMLNAGEGGAHIGATITHAYINGILTTTPLWNSGADYRFIGCGATVNSDGLDTTSAGNSCINAHERITNFHAAASPRCTPPY